MKIHNKRGWGLTVKKVWSDADYMDAHDDIYFAVYVKGELLNGTVRKLASPATSLYYYFDRLVDNAAFEDYEVYEVTLTNPQTDANGNISYDEISKIEKQDGILTVDGKPKGEAHQNSFSYEVTYAKGQATGGTEDVLNVRTDTVTNTRRGIRMLKQDWNETALSGAVFTLKDDEENPVGANTYTSNNEGLITIAYLQPGTYTLEEITAPNGFQKASPWTITVKNNDVIEVDGVNGTFGCTQATEEEMAVITFKNKGFSLQAVKVDENDAGNKLNGAVFALYNQTETLSGPERAKYPIKNYGSLTTDENGVIPSITSSLSAGTYYLSEVTAPLGYELLNGDLIFTISSGGEVTIPVNVHTEDSNLVILNNIEDLNVESWLERTESDGDTSYVITIPNKKAGVPVQILKADQNGMPLEDAVFTLKGGDIDKTDLRSKIRSSDVDGKNAGSENSEVEESAQEAIVYEDPALPIGTYTLTETSSPSDYFQLEDPIEIQVTGNGTVTATVNGSPSDSAIVEMIDNKHPEYGWKVTVKNTRIYTLPSAGGPGTYGFTIIGVAIACTAVMLFFDDKRYAVIRKVRNLISR